MHFESLADFLSMGGRGLYVWLSYLAFVLVVASWFIATHLKYRWIVAEQRRYARLNASDSPSENER